MVAWYLLLVMVKVARWILKLGPPADLDIYIFSQVGLTVLNDDIN